MSHYLMGVYEELEEECRAPMLHDYMDLTRLMVHAQQVEDSRLRKRNRETKSVNGLRCEFLFIFMLVDVRNK